MVPMSARRWNFKATVVENREKHKNKQKKQNKQSVEEMNTKSVRCQSDAPRTCDHPSLVFGRQSDDDNNTRYIVDVHPS